MSIEAPHHFELHLTLPADVRFAAMVRALAMHGARVAGVDENRVSGFGAAVEDAAREMLSPARPEPIPVVVRFAGGPLEIAIDQGVHARTLTLDV